MRIIAYPRNQVDGNSCEHLVDHGNNQGDSIDGEEGGQLGVLVVLTDHEVVIAVLLVGSVTLLVSNLVTEALDVSFVRDSLLFLLRCRQASPLDDRGRLQLFVGVTLNNRRAVNRDRILVQQPVRALGADKNQQEGAREKEDKEDGNEDTLEEARPL